jgi:hypothetical protein
VGRDGWNRRISSEEGSRVKWCDGKCGRRSGAKDAGVEGAGGRQIFWDCKEEANRVCGRYEIKPRAIPSSTLEHVTFSTV